ncbi:MAG: hypothetical protein KKF50_02015 [Nanoarchaeota archaeon]|nr:hypothetical protein [Nanoarchaeota archaeon]
MDETTTAKEMQNSGKDSPVEILVGFDGYYNFQLGGDDKKFTKNKFSTSNWDNKMFYETGQEVARWIHKNNSTNYTISNGQINKLAYDISEEEAESIVRMIADDPFFSGSYPKHHFERTDIRPLMPEQLEMFKAGLEYRLQVLQGKIIEPPKELPRRSESERLYTYLRAQQPALAFLQENMARDIKSLRNTETN